MPIGTIVKAWKDSSRAYVSIRIGNIEYIGDTPLVGDAGAIKGASELKTALIADVSKRYIAQNAGLQALALTGTVNV